MNNNAPAKHIYTPGRLSPKSLARALFKAEVPESMVRSLPAQSLYMAIRQNGLQSSTDILELATFEQQRLMLDLDVWHGDSFSEDNFWEWLNVLGGHRELTLLQRLLKSVDLKLVALILARHVSFAHFDEPTDEAPGPAWYTPDKGLTWIFVKVEDKDRYFSLGRFMALIFESNPDLFYQLLSITQTESESSLEEQAYQERISRISSHGIPDADFAHELNTPLPPDAAAAQVNKGERQPPIRDICSIEPLLYESGLLQPLASLLTSPEIVDELELELSLLMNAGIVCYHVDFCEQDRVLELAACIKGAANIGLETLISMTGRTTLEIHAALGLSGIYRTGLARLFDLRRLSRTISKRSPGVAENNLPLQVILEATGAAFPRQPAFFKVDGPFEETDGKLTPGDLPIECKAQIDALSNYLKSQPQMN